jgi:peroxiredoxin
MENSAMLSRFRISPRRLARLGLEVLVFLGLLLAMERFLTRDAVRGPAPPLAATLVDGDRFDATVLRGRPAIVYFWATWCPVCGAQQGTLDTLLNDTPGVTVALRSAQDLRAYLRAERLDWPVIDDADGAISRSWGVSGVPAVFVLDRQGRVRFVTRGYTSSLGLRARLWLAAWD